MAATGSDDDVQLPDLQVIQRYSLAVRGASAPRDEVIAALTADLEWLRGGTRRAPSRAAAPRKASAGTSSTSSTSSSKPAKRTAKATKSGARKA